MTNKSASNKPAPTKAPRKLKAPQYKTFRLSKRIAHPAGRLPKSRILLGAALSQLWSKRRLYGAILGMFAVLYIILVRGFAGTDLTIVKDAFQETSSGGAAQATTGFGMFFYLLGTSTTLESEVASLYQMVLLVITSLALIWALRQTQATTPVQSKITMRDAYYSGNAPIVPFILVVLTIGLQFIPALIGTTLYQQVSTTGLAASGIESAAWLILMLMTLLLSLYMVSSSVFALYIVTLPDMTPMRALRSARELVRFRRWEVMRKVLFLPFVLFVGGFVICLPLLLYVTIIAEYVFFFYGIVCLAIAHSYMYQLYRKLL